MKKLLSAPDPARALLWMRQAGVLSRILPESEKWGIDAVHALVAAERERGWTPDAMLRLEAIVPPDSTRLQAMAERLRMSKAEAARLTVWAEAPAPAASMSDAELAGALYRGNRQGIGDRLRLSVASAQGAANGDGGGCYTGTCWTFAETWKKPLFPVKGGDLKRSALRTDRRSARCCAVSRMSGSSPVFNWGATRSPGAPRNS